MTGRFHSLHSLALCCAVGIGLIAWLAEDKIILSDNDWKYSITPSGYDGGNAAIERVNDLGQKEAWHYDLAEGKETVLSADGITRLSQRFVTGPLVGRTRSVVRHLADGTRMTEYVASYDESGNLLREKQEELEVRYRARFQPIEIWKAGKLIYRYSYHESGRFAELLRITPEGEEISIAKNDETR